LKKQIYIIYIKQVTVSDVIGAMRISENDCYTFLDHVLWENLISKLWN